MGLKRRVPLGQGPTSPDAHPPSKASINDRHPVPGSRACAPPCPHPQQLAAAGEAGRSRKKGRPRHLQFTLQSTVQSQWQRQKQWKAHSLLTITGRPPGAVREACSSHPGHLPLLPQPPGLCSGKLICQPAAKWASASIFNEAFQLTYCNPPVYPIPASSGGPGGVSRPPGPAHSLGDTRCLPEGTAHHGSLVCCG